MEKGETLLTSLPLMAVGRNATSGENKVGMVAHHRYSNKLMHCTFLDWFGFMNLNTALQIQWKSQKKTDTKVVHYMKERSMLIWYS